MPIMKLQAEVRLSSTLPMQVWHEPLTMFRCSKMPQLDRQSLVEAHTQNKPLYLEHGRKCMHILIAETVDLIFYQYPIATFNSLSNDFAGAFTVVAPGAYKDIRQNAD